MDGTAPRRRAPGLPPAGDGTWPGSSLLGSLTAPARGRLLALGAVRRYEADHVLMREGERTAFVLVLLHGVVKATGRAPDGRNALLAVRMGGDLVGEFAAADGGPRSATVTTCGDVVARAVGREEFLACTRDDPGIAHAVNAAVVAKLRAANTHRVDFTGCDAATRLARVLHQIVMTRGERSGAGAVIRWPITQPELATLSGTAEPTVQKVLRRFRRAGVISTGYRTVRVEDLDRLSDLAFREQT
ncbi:MULTISPECIES: Crp/Fnr family transcriptional regulator [Streptomyces]|uniref:Crp/Fnr family transcriptional regulator n=3 Tax=Streptomyces TaxID=1883 RepID=A0A7K3RJP6_STRAQ|nr:MULTISPECIES: Crp/Fnr family transcriptional regulator [Streptomyces]NDZ61353.1 Crp/Fnr family transcriptional regulator [Streptomyces anulatus]NEC02373.1 Crp/Fnr family transcriptional regulator [Streptomyces anulatus]NED29505.1 Crp/Fnr family transcriptional regulator [Streptomyces anulatus]OLO31572.1 Crp/Fnr family transcriptional regulator [Streptomyces sp. MNU77]OWA23150.1 Crp/Fnr family transcriptional regulator [Streptomyces sp. CS057]